MKDFDFSRINNVLLFCKNNITILLLILCVMLSFFIRVSSYDIPYTDTIGKDVVDDNIRNSILMSINQQYPNLPDTNKNELVEKQFNDIVAQMGSQYGIEVAKVSEYFKDNLKDDNNVRYLSAIDPYFYARQVRLLSNTGSICDSVKDGVCWNDYTMAPVGKKAEPNLHAYFSYYLYKVVGIFKIPLEQMFLFVPAIIISLSIIPLFFLVRNYFGSTAAFISSIYMSLHPLVFGRTELGFADTDAYVVLFLCLSTYLFFKSFNTENKWLVLLYSGLCGLSIGLFAFAWAGWWFILDILVAVSIVYLVYYVIKFKDLKTHILKALIGLLFFSMLFIPLFSDYDIMYAIDGPLSRVDTINAAAHVDLWPNIQTTVAELGDLSVPQIINNLGMGSSVGKLFVALSLLGVVFCFVDKDTRRNIKYSYIGACLLLILLIVNIDLHNIYVFLSLLSLIPIIGLALNVYKIKNNYHVLFGLLLSAWFIVSIFASTRGSRFLMLLIPAFAIGLGITMDRIIKALLGTIYPFGGEKYKIITTVVLVTMCVFIPIGIATKVASVSMPSMNDAWDNALTNIRENTPKDSIINSWWDFGHWFKYVADRRVTVDGAGQHYQLAYWMGTVLLSDNENISVSTLRMLDCEGINEYNRILKENDYHTLLSLSIINDDIKNGKEYCTPPDNYLITSDDMVSKAGVWAHFGSWDFNRAYALSLYDNGYDEFMSKINDSAMFSEISLLDSDDARNSWIAGWPQYYTRDWVKCYKDNNTYKCNVNLFIGYENNNRMTIIGVEYDNPKNATFVVTDGNRFYKMKPNAVVTAEDTFTKFINDEINKINIDVVVNNDSIILADPYLSSSLFTHLYFLDGKYTDRFEKFSEDRSPFGTVIKVWRVKW